MSTHHFSLPAPDETQATLLVFTRGRREARRLLPGALARHETQLRRAFLDCALEAASRAQCRTVVCSPDAVERPTGAVPLAQRGQSFGERLATAVGACHAADGRAVMVVPADVPGLTATHLQQAKQTLAEDPEAVVIGPSPDGGLYLLAAVRPLPLALLQQVRWCRRNTRHHLLTLLARAGRRAVLLEPLADLDGPADLERWLAEGATLPRRWHRLLGSLLAALQAFRIHSGATSLPLATPSRRLPWAGRAPPLSLAA